MKNVKKILVLLALVSVFASCKKTLFEPEIDNTPEAIFEAFWSDFNLNYPNMANRNVNWDSLYTVYRPLVNDQTTEEELYLIVSAMIKELNDGHVALITPNRDVYRSNIYYREKVEDELFSLDLVKTNYLGNNLHTSSEESNTYGMIGSVGYVHFEWISYNVLDFKEILNSFSGSNGLIIDLRHNGGGNFTFGLTELRRLVPEEQFVFREKTKNGTDKNAFTPWHYWSIFPEGEFYDKPVIVLTDRYTISAGERVVMMFKALPNCTIVGDTTNGAISTKIGRELPNGWNYTITPQIIESPDGMNYDGPGIPPDIYFKNTTSGMNSGVDEILEYALSLF